MPADLRRNTDEAKEKEEEETSWWRDRISDLEEERSALLQQAKVRAKNEEKRLKAIAEIREEAEIQRFPYRTKTSYVF